MNGIPVIRLELDHMKHAIMHAFSDMQVRMDADVRAAVETFCQPENIRHIVDTAVNSTLKEAIKREVESFYTYGAGREVIKEAVRKHLDRDYGNF